MRNNPDTENSNIWPRNGLNYDIFVKSRFNNSYEVSDILNWLDSIFSVSRKR